MMELNSKNKKMIDFFSKNSKIVLIRKILNNERRQASAV